MEIPVALGHKRRAAARELQMQYLFASAVLRRDETGKSFRWHLTPARADAVVVQAAKAADRGVLRLPDSLAWRSAWFTFKAGEGGRTLDIHVGNVHQLLDFSLEKADLRNIMGQSCAT